MILVNISVGALETSNVTMRLDNARQAVHQVGQVLDVNTVSAASCI